MKTTFILLAALVMSGCVAQRKQEPILTSTNEVEMFCPQLKGQTYQRTEGVMIELLEASSPRLSIAHFVSTKGDSCTCQKANSNLAPVCRFESKKEFDERLANNNKKRVEQGKVPLTPADTISIRQ
jgi:hypothetical protein